CAAIFCRCTIAVVLFASPLVAQDAPPPNEDGPPPKNWTEQVEQSATLIDIYPDLGAETPVDRVNAYKWSNTARGQVLGDRLCLLYVHQGRPVASCKVYPTGRSIVHTFVTMTDQPIVALQSKLAVWTPPSAELKWTPLDDFAAPHATAAGRSVQMRAIAREFRGEIGAGEARRQKSSPQLRLLPQPIYRYDLSEAQPDGVIDGAVFAYTAEGGNPELLLMVEALDQEGTLSWRSAFNRRSIAETKGFYRDAEVWKVDFLPASALSSTGPLYKLDLPAVEPRTRN
ncbi:MAG: hypothetical protein KDA75_07505, partial [Planctomycetaceae bacterium]|nr:hypothetical protein [Planctomycetaceae bacterium]